MSNSGDERTRTVPQSPEGSAIRGPEVRESMGTPPPDHIRGSRRDERLARCAGLDLIDLLDHVQLSAAFRSCDEQWHRRIAAGIQGERTCRGLDR